MQNDDWASEIVTHLELLEKRANSMDKMHDMASKYFRRKEVMFGLPPVVLAAVMAPITLMVSAATHDTCDVVTLSDYVSTMGFTAIAFFSSVAGFFRYGVRSEKHGAFSARYSDVASDIGNTLIKRRLLRQNSEVVLENVKLRLDFLTNLEPSVPEKIEKQFLKETRNFD